MRIFIFLLTLIIPTIIFAAEPLIPCDGPTCQACDFLELGQRLMTWFIQTMTIVIALIFAWGGMEMVMSGGDEGKVHHGKEKMTNSIVGFIILLSAWLVVDTVLKTFVTGAELGVWNAIQCVDPVARTQTSTPGSVSTLPSGLPSAAGAVGTYKEQLCTIAGGAGINDCASMLAIMTQESGGNPNAQSSAGAIGLMQIMPSVARTVDSSLQGKTDEEVRQKLLDPTYNMQIATAHYKDVVQKYGGANYDTVYAVYNGGAGAVEPSKDCPGLAKWQCVWDSPGCYGTSNTNCTPNTGYIETRDYVTKVNNYRQVYAQ